MEYIFEKFSFGWTFVEQSHKHLSRCWLATLLEEIHKHLCRCLKIKNEPIKSKYLVHSRLGRIIKWIIVYYLFPSCCYLKKISFGWKSKAARTSNIASYLFWIMIVTRDISPSLVIFLIKERHLFKCDIIYSEEIIIQAHLLDSNW